MQIYHRGSPATDSEFNLLHTWAKTYQNELFDLLDTRFIMFGEWMLLKHTIFYDNLPCHNHYEPVFFLESDIYDQKSHCFMSTEVRHALLKPFPFIHSVPVLRAFVPEKLSDLTDLVGPSKYITEDAIDVLGAECIWKKLDLQQVFNETLNTRSSKYSNMEGLYIKHETNRCVIDRYKYVRYEFLETILNSGTHFKDRPRIHNVALGRK